jgi:hypothetical protein
MSDVTDAAESMAAAEPTAPTPTEAQALEASGEAEGTTPEEVAQVLKSSGMNLPTEPVAEADAEEGDDPDAVVAEEVTPEVPEEVANEEPIEPETEPAPKPEPETAPETTTDDKYSFTVVDADGVTFKVNAGDTISDVLEDFKLKNDAQAIEILDKLRDVKDLQRADQADNAKAEADAANAKVIEDIQTGWNNEFKALDINEEGRREEVMKFMSQENDKRETEGRPLIRTVEHALLGLEKQEAKAATEKAAKDAKETARKNGGLVGGSSAPATSAPATYRAGSARNANEAIKSMGLL